MVYITGDEKDLIPKRRYVSFDGDISNIKPIQDYFQGVHTFKSKDGEVFTGEVVNDKYVIDFLRKGEELRNSITDENEGEMKM